MHIRSDAGFESRDPRAVPPQASPESSDSATLLVPKDKVSLPSKLFKSADVKLLPAPREEEPKKAGKAEEAPRTVKVRFKAQDDLLPPKEIEVPADQIGTKLDGPRFKVHEDPNAFRTPVADKDGNYIFKIDDPRLGAVNSYVSASKALDIAEKYLGRKIDWGFKRESDKERIWIHPHAGAGLNAFYNSENGSLNFLYGQDGMTNSLVDASTSLEVVGHEAGHAILDGIRPHYLQSLDPSSGGFHEAFGDVIAMLCSLSEDDVLEALYQQTGGDLSEPNIISDMGEQLGRAMRGKKHEYVRQGLNDHKYRDSHFLPFFSMDGPALEPHQYSGVWTGANYDILRLLVAGKMQDSSATFLDAVKASRDELGTLAVRSLEFAPPGKMSFKEAAIAMLKTDAIEFGGAHLQELLAVFMGREIFTPDDAEKFMTDLALTKVMRDVGKLKLDEKFDPAKDAKENGAQQLLEAKGPMLGLSAEEIKGLEYEGCKTNEKGERILLYGEEKKVILEEPEWGAIFQGNSFSIHGGLVLAFDKDGDLLTLTRDAITEDDIDEGKHFLRKMLDFEKNPPIIIRTKGKPGHDDDEKDVKDPHLEYLLASTRQPIEVVNGQVRKKGIVY